jgi:hypothetical protein
MVRAAHFAMSAVALEVLALLSVAIVNGYPVIFVDSPSYFHLWFAGNRSPIFNFFVVGLRMFSGSLWALVIVQSLLVLFFLHRLFAEFSFAERPMHRALVIVLLAVLTPLPWETGYAMPDVLIAPAVIATFLVLFGRRPRSLWEQSGLFLVIAFGAASHNANLWVLAPLVIGSAMLMGLTGDFGRSRRRLFLASAALTTGALAMASVNYARVGHFRVSFSAYPLLANRFAEGGLLQKFLADYCPSRNDALCRYESELTQQRDMFVWGSYDPAQGPWKRERSILSKLGGWVDSRDALKGPINALLRQYPREVGSLILSESFEQLKTFDIANSTSAFPEGYFVHKVLADHYPSEVAAFRASRQQRRALNWPEWARLHEAVVVAALIVVGLLFAVRLVPPEHGRFLFVVTLAVLANAVVCGGVSHTEFRYGSRIIWLLPLAVALAAAGALHRYRSRCSAVGEPEPIWPSSQSRG